MFEESERRVKERRARIYRNFQTPGIFDIKLHAPTRRGHPQTTTGRDCLVPFPVTWALIDTALLYIIYHQYKYILGVA